MVQGSQLQGGLASVHSLRPVRKTLGSRKPTCGFKQTLRLEQLESCSPCGALRRCPRGVNMFLRGL